MSLLSIGITVTVKPCRRAAGLYYRKAEECDKASVSHVELMQKFITEINETNEQDSRSTRETGCFLYGENYETEL